MGDVIQARYAELEQVANRFRQLADEGQQLTQSIRGAFEPLESGGWKGKGANAHIAEMYDEIFPALGRLAQALEEADEVAQKIGNTLRQADEETRSYFRIS